MARPSNYPEEFRREAVQIALATEDSRASVARLLGVNETTLPNRWPTTYPNRPGAAGAFEECVPACSTSPPPDANTTVGDGGTCEATW